MATHKMKIGGKREIAEGTIEYLFNKNGSFDFTAGQFCDFQLIHPEETDDEGNIRTFSIVNSPHHKGFIKIATRNRDTAFKRCFSKLQEGSEINVMGPDGDFLLPEGEAKNSPLIFLAGGIGITPFHSMIEFSINQKTDHKMKLFHSNRNKASFPYFDELLNWSKGSSVFNYFATLSDEADENWNFDRGRIGSEMLKKHLSGDELNEGKFFLAGPPSFVNGVFGVLINDLKIERERIKADEFSGY